MTCPHEGCVKPVKARGLCDTHYRAARRAGLFVPRTYVGCWSINAFNKQDCCGRCDHVSEASDG